MLNADEEDPQQPLLDEPEETPMELYEKAHSLMMSGTPVREACENVGLTPAKFYYIRAKKEGRPRPASRSPEAQRARRAARAAAQKKAPVTRPFVDIPLKEPEKPKAKSKVAVVVCEASQLLDILEGLNK